MIIVNKNPSSKVLKQGYQKFYYHWWYLIILIFLFPLVYYWSKKYCRLFFNFTQDYQRAGKLQINHKLVEFNSFEHYHADLADKKLTNFSFSPQEEQQIQELTILNHNGDELSMLILENSVSNKWVIGLHGWTENKYLALRQVYYFYQQGYNILTFDSVAHGLSYGQYSAIGYLNAQNVEDVTQWLMKNYLVSEFGVIGNSMGASCASLYALNYGYQNPKLKWIISDCGFINLLVQFRYVMTYRYQKPWWLISWGLRRIFKKQLGVDIKKYNLLKKHQRIKNIPFLLFHGEQDVFVPFFMSQKFINQKLKYEPQQISELVALPFLDHVEAISKGHDLYLAKIKKFLESEQELKNEITKEI